MTYKQLRERALYQTSNDADDMSEFQPHLGDYVNEGYERVLYAYARKHLGDDGYPALSADADEPELPERYHQAIADWATWLIYRNGNPQKQSRGMAFRAAAEAVMARGAGGDGAAKYFINLP